MGRAVRRRTSPIWERPSAHGTTCSSSAVLAMPELSQTRTGARTGQRVPTTQLPSLPHLLSGDPLARKVRWHLQDQWIPSVHLGCHCASWRTWAPGCRTYARAARAERRTVQRHRPSSPSARSHGARPQPFVRPSDDDEGTSPPARGRASNVACSEPSRIPLVQRQLRRLICPSDYYRDLHVGLGIVRPERAITIRQGAKPGRARVRTETASPTIGMLGALAPHKGLHTLLEAFESAPASWRLHGDGSGPDQDDVVVAATVDSRIRYHGIVDGPGKEAFFDRIDVLAIPSEWEENAPLVAAEAAVRQSHGGQRQGQPAGDQRGGGLHRRGPQAASRGNHRAGEAWRAPAGGRCASAGETGGVPLGPARAAGRGSTGSLGRRPEWHPRQEAPLLLNGNEDPPGRS